MYLGIEIGGTKLQLGVGLGDGSPLVELQRATINPAAGATAILTSIESMSRGLIDRYHPKAIGIGFGGPVDAKTGRTINDQSMSKVGTIFRWRSWSHRQLDTADGGTNDADTAGLAEALFGAGRGKRVVFYITVGSGVAVR